MKRIEIQNINNIFMETYRHDPPTSWSKPLFPARSVRMIDSSKTLVNNIDLSCIWVFLKGAVNKTV